MPAQHRGTMVTPANGGATHMFSPPINPLAEVLESERGVWADMTGWTSSTTGGGLAHGRALHRVHPTRRPSDERGGTASVRPTRKAPLIAVAAERVTADGSHPQHLTHSRHPPVSEPTAQGPPEQSRPRLVVGSTRCPTCVSTL
eukprot:6173433-Pleurochrysis_carterae.AAC.4